MARILPDEALEDLALFAEILVLNDQRGDWRYAIPIRLTTVGYLIQRRLGLLSLQLVPPQEA